MHQATHAFVKLIEQQKQKWPSAIVSRNQVFEFSGGAVTPGHLANCDSQGTGPKERFYLGRKCCYSLDALCDWLISQARSANTAVAVAHAA